jgi:FkbM family methyltransferase
MILGTRHLFLALLRTLRIDTACDVGSMNGAEALAFRRARPGARVCAFEPNPGNLRLMRADARLAAASVEVMPYAAADQAGPVTFYLVEADYTQAHHRRGMSSLYERPDPTWRAPPVTVEAVRLDGILARDGAARRMALWVDVEGKAYEALQGAHGILAETLLLHVELESQPCIASGQHLYPEVRALLEGAGFSEIATDQPKDAAQFNGLYLRRGLPRTLRVRIAAVIARSWLRHRAVQMLRAVCPACITRLKRLGHLAPMQAASGSTSSEAPARDR